MNVNMIAKYLQILRKSHNYTQDELASKLDISRQAVSKWETGTAVPDLDVLLKISKLYDITINDILEPRIQPQRITDFEQISTISEKELKEALEQCADGRLRKKLKYCLSPIEHFRLLLPAFHWCYGYIPHHEYCSSSYDAKAYMLYDKRYLYGHHRLRLILPRPFSVLQSALPS